MKVLVANRGEIAVRVIRACRDHGLRTVAVFSECDRTALHTRMADEAFLLGPSPAAESYLRLDRLVDIARRAGASLVHPGYGFLAENAAFAEACAAAGLVFVGPSPDAIRIMGSKTAAREAASRAGVPVVPGGTRPWTTPPSAAEARAEADRVGFPLLVKAVAGGGGKGMRAVTGLEELDAALRAAASEAAASFGDASIYLERRLDAPRHIEIQVLADAHGRVMPFVERECSIQRRHQKVVEESPASNLDAGTRRQLADAAVRIARAVGYTNAGTLEFLVDRQQRFFFLEMNTRLQVEHPVTEQVTGVDLVRWQLRIALGERLDVPEAQALTPNGHAIECRIYAEDPDRGFLPAPGLVRDVTAPGGPGIREDRGVAEGGEVPVFYDSLVSKLIVWGQDRAEAVARLTRALDEYRFVGLTTTIPFFQWLVQQPAFLTGDVDTTYLDRVLGERNGAPFVTPAAESIRDAALAAALAAWFKAHRGAAAPAASGGWRSAARRDALR